MPETAHQTCLVFWGVFFTLARWNAEGISSSLGSVTDAKITHLPESQQHLSDVDATESFKRFSEGWQLIGSPPGDLRKCLYFATDVEFSERTEDAAEARNH